MDRIETQNFSLVLPDKEISDYRARYGNRKVAARYIGLKNVPSTLNGEWQHGWMGPERNINPEFVTGSTGKTSLLKEKQQFLVARMDQVEYLNEEGYSKVKAIGLPFIYTNPPSVQRIPNSLLIMPIHSLNDTKEDWLTESANYATYLDSIRSKFDFVCACVHPSCIKKGNWVKDLEQLNITIIEGADKCDENALNRMATLFKQFEFTTTNDFGSHVAYASYYGSKVSVSGPKPKWYREEYESTMLYSNVPELLDILEDWQYTNKLASLYPQFLCEPWEATLQESWSRWQLGEQHKLSAKELKSVLGWTTKDLIESRVMYYIRTVANKLR